jgi:hypothetical protein
MGAILIERGCKGKREEGSKRGREGERGVGKLA